MEDNFVNLERKGMHGGVNVMIKEDLNDQISGLKKISNSVLQHPYYKSGKNQTEIPDPISEIVGRGIRINYEKLVNMAIDDLVTETVILLNYFEEDQGKKGMEEQIKEMAMEFLGELKDFKDVQDVFQVRGHRIGRVGGNMGQTNKVGDIRMGIKAQELRDYDGNIASWNKPRARTMREKGFDYKQDILLHKIRSRPGAIDTPQVKDHRRMVKLERGFANHITNQMARESRPRKRTTYQDSNYIKAMEHVTDDLVHKLLGDVAVEVYDVQQNFMEDVVRRELGMDDQDSYQGKY